MCLATGVRVDEARGHKSSRRGFSAKAASREKTIEMDKASGQAEHPVLDLLRTRNMDLCHQAQHLITRAKEVLPHTLPTFPSGTAHGPEHTTTVERISHLIIAGDVASNLNDFELFFHVLSCHYHDLGMAGTEADNETPETRDQVRRDHAVRIAEILNSRWEELGFDNPTAIPAEPIL